MTPDRQKLEFVSNFMSPFIGITGIVICTINKDSANLYKIP